MFLAAPQEVTSELGLSRLHVEDLAVEQTVTLLHADAATWTACQEEHPQVCSHICLALAEVRQNTPSLGLRGTHEGRSRGPLYMGPTLALLLFFSHDLSPPPPHATTSAPPPPPPAHNLLHLLLPLLLQGLEAGQVVRFLEGVQAVGVPQNDVTQMGHEAQALQHRNVGRRTACGHARSPGHAPSVREPPRASLRTKSHPWPCTGGGQTS